MNNVEKLYKLWSTDPYFDEHTKAELVAIADDEAEIKERFYQNLAFGTAGLRGVLGAGTNRMNMYTVGKAAWGFADYVAGLGDEAKKRGIVISYDSRHFSPEFADLSARIFAQHGIMARLFDELRPVPMLSYAVRYYNCIGGIMITASHNPKEYNGFKAYGDDGCQLPPEAADGVMKHMEAITDLRDIRVISREEALETGCYRVVGPEIDDAYMTMLKKLSIHRDLIKDQADMKIVYTPLHGSGNKPIRRILAELGFKNILVVPEQVEPDPDFSTVEKPNPEFREALQMAIDLAEKEKADLVIATDPDADRTGLAVKRKDDSYDVLTGNQIGLLLMEYILSAKYERGVLPPNSFVASTIVSTKLSKKVAAAYGVKLFEVLTGFKFIGELIKDYDEFGDMHFQFGFEESFGYLAGTDVRDKDAVVTSMLLAEMAAVARSKGRTISDELDALYEKYGYGFEETISIKMEGISGQQKIAAALGSFRNHPPRQLGDFPIKVVRDYLNDTRTDLDSGEKTALGLPSSNVLLYELEGLDWFCIRPSGTEPLIKIYTGAYGPEEAPTKARLAEITREARSALEKLL